MERWVAIAFALISFAGTGDAIAAFATTRLTIWDLKLGQPAISQPAPENFRAFACGSNGGPPRLQIAGWAEYARCPADANKMHEVYFEYDDELEYIARAKGAENQVTRWAGTQELGYPVVTSALFDDSGILMGIRLVTDPRPGYRDDLIRPDLKDRSAAFQLGGLLAGRFNLVPTRDCQSIPPAEGESAVAGVFLKKRCELVDTANNLHILVESNLYRRPGESEYDPQQPNALTTGQYESSSRADILVLKKSAN